MAKDEKVSAEAVGQLNLSQNEQSCALHPSRSRSSAAACSK